MFMKAITVMAGLGMIGATATAGMYPEPFTSNTAIIVGDKAALSDNAAAARIASNLDSASAGMGGSVTIEGESYKFDKSATHFHIGDNIVNISSTALDDDELPTVLADIKYQDTNNDEFDATQKLSIGSNLRLTMFEDNDYAEDEPTVGFRVPSGTTVATYTLDFSDQPDFADLANTDFTIMGKDYYVLSAPTTNDKITLLDSAQDTILSEGSSTTVNAGGTSYTVEIVHIASNEVILSVNGEQTNSLGEGETYKLDSSAHVGVKDILYSSKDTGISKVEFSIGQGKLVLEDGQEVVLNEDTVNGLSVAVTNASAKLDQIVITWATDDDEFITLDTALTMPGFEAVKFVYGGVDFPMEEEIRIEPGNDEYIELASFPLKDSTEDIPLIYTDTVNYTGIGKDSTSQLATGTTSVSFDGNTDDYFVASYASTSEAESYLSRATNFKVENSVNKTTVQYRKDGAWVDAISDGQIGDTFDMGSAEMNITAINKVSKTVTITNISASTNFNTLYSKEGLKVTLPILDTDIDSENGTTSYALVFEEEDKDENIGSGGTITATLGLESDGDVTVTSWTSSDKSVADSKEIGDSDVFRSFVYSDLATEVLHNRKSGGNYDLKLMYHGDEVKADVFVAATDSTSSTTSGVRTYTDVNAASASGMNLVVVGGSAINSVAADLLGGAFSEAAFTAETGVGAGEFLIQSFDRSGKTALLVAGYNAADTDKAATYVVNEDVDTTVGMKYKGTAANSATLVTV